MKETWEEFEIKVKGAGLVAKKCATGHWQVLGGAFRVNYYPATGTVYLNQASKGIPGSVEVAIRMARELPELRRKGEVGRDERLGPGKAKRLRRKFYKKKPWCFWCGTVFADVGEATLEHVIPLARGGSNEEVNLALACKRCNAMHGNGRLVPVRRVL